MEYINMIKFPPHIEYGLECLVGGIGTIHADHNHHGTLARQAMTDIHALLLKCFRPLGVFLVPV